MKSKYSWLDQLLRADSLMERRSKEYQATLGNPDALINSVEWQRFAAAAERRDALRDRYWKELLELAAKGRVS